MIAQRISQSKLKSWKYCRAGYYEQYVLGISPPNPNFMLGGDKHLQVEMYHKGLTEITDRDGVLHKYDPAKTEHYRSVWPDPKYFDIVEQKYYVEFHHPITGLALPVMSLVMDTARTGELINDYKTSEASWSQNAVDDPLSEKGLQATTYCYAWWEMTGDILPFKYTVERKNPGPRTAPIAVIETHRTIADFAAFHDWAVMTLKEIEDAIEYPCTCFGGAHKLIEVRL